MNKKQLLELDLSMSKMEEDIIEYPKKHHKMIMVSYLLDGTQVVVCVASYFIWWYMVFAIKFPLVCTIIILPLTWATLDSFKNLYKTYRLYNNIKKSTAAMEVVAKKRREIFDRELGIDNQPAEKMTN